jgi:hypothetical protein
MFIDPLQSTQSEGGVATAALGQLQAWLPSNAAMVPGVMAITREDFARRFNNK